jgi:hypothetical protein
MQTIPRSNVQRILIGSVAPVARGMLRDQDGELVAPSGTVTASVYSLNGTLSGTAGRATTALTDTGKYTMAFTTAEASTLNVWRVDWLVDGVKRAETFHRIVGGFMISRAELEEQSGIGGNFTTEALDEAREWITNLIEHQTGAAWCPRYDVDQFTGRCWATHATEFRPVRAVRSVTVDDGTVIDLADVITNYDAGTVTLDATSFYGVCEIGYEHGYDSPPESLRRAALVAAADVLNRAQSGLSERTRSVSNDLGYTQQFSFPGLNHPTGIDFVDAAIMDNDQRLPSLG